MSSSADSPPGKRRKTDPKGKGLGALAKLEAEDKDYDPFAEEPEFEEAGGTETASSTGQAKGEAELASKDSKQKTEAKREAPPEPAAAAEPPVAKPAEAKKAEPVAPATEQTVPKPPWRVEKDLLGHSFHLCLLDCHLSKNLLQDRQLSKDVQEHRFVRQAKLLSLRRVLVTAQRLAGDADYVCRDLARKACPAEGFREDVSTALSRPGTSYQEAAEKLGCRVEKVKRAAHELGGKREAWSFLHMGENAGIAVAKLPALLTLLCARTPALFEAFHKATVEAAHKPLSLVLSFDEATAGNVLAPDPAKKACMLYIACKEVGVQSPALWWPVSVVRADIMKHHLHGNLGIVLRYFLRTNPAEQLMAGFWVETTGHTPFVLRVRIAAVIADGEALRQSLSCKGAAGLKPCHICKNVIKKNHDMTGSLQGYLQDISSLPGSWDRMTDEEIFQFCDEQRRRKTVLSAAAFKEEETLAGIVYNEESLLQDSWARLQLPPSVFMYDFLHIYFTKGGVASLEVSFIVQRAAAALNVSHEDLADLLREHAWRVPGHIKNFAGPANRARLFDSSRFMELGYKSKASDLQQLLPLLGCLLEMLDTENVLRPEMSSYHKLFQIQRELGRLKALDDVESTQSLQRLQSEHHVLCVQAYGEKILKPKHHWRFHAAEQVQNWQAYIDTGPCETKHQLYKAITERNYDAVTHHASWSEAIALRLLISSHEQVRTFYADQAEVFIGKPTRCTGPGLSYRAVRLHGRHWTQGDFLLEPVPGQILRCLKDSADRPVLLLRQYRPATTAVFSTLFRRTSTVRHLHDLRRTRHASWWLCENEDVVRAVP
ncbi:unnamed protein product [Symbiodinium sp. CCMP2456]|nr:unnamed protein product [Symbiodinium sp. CCMP2456]